MVDIASLQRVYFTFDKPVPYSVDGITLTITPILLPNAEAFLSSIDILQYDKDSAPSVEIIQMSYLEYMVSVIADADPLFSSKLSVILHYCVGIDNWRIEPNEHGKYVLYDDTHGVVLTAKKFNELTRIILYQNILNYDDEYVNPELRKMMDEVDAVKNYNVEFPTLERQISIITAHTGITKKQQCDMTLREHQGLFREVGGEIDFTTLRAISAYAGKEVEHWIYRRKRGKYDGYMTSMGAYKNSFGGDGSIANVAIGDGSSHAEKLVSQYNL